MTAPTPVTELGYADALAELESILDRLEHDEPDVDRVATDVARGVVSVAAARSIYGVVVDAAGALDEAGTAGARAAIRGERLAAATVPEPAGPLVLTGTGKHRYGDALVADFDRDEIACGHCGHVLGRGGHDLFPQLREFETPLEAAGPVRGEDYAAGRFKLRHLCCSSCGGLIDVQVALQGVPRAGMRIEYA